MASSSRATKKGTALRTKVPDKYTAQSAFMLYAASDADLTVDGGHWVPVERINGPYECNVGPVEFDLSITICQKAKVKTNRCYLRFSPQEYAYAGASLGTEAHKPFQVTIKCLGPHQCRLEGNHEAAGQLPLAKLCGEALSFGYIRLMIPSRKLKRTGGNPAVNDQGMLGHLRTLLTSQPATPSLSQLTVADMKKHVAGMEQLWQDFRERNFADVLRSRQAELDAKVEEPEADEAAIRLAKAVASADSKLQY